MQLIYFDGPIEGSPIDGPGYDSKVVSQTNQQSSLSTATGMIYSIN